MVKIRNPSVDLAVDRQDIGSTVSAEEIPKPGAITTLADAPGDAFADAAASAVATVPDETCVRAKDVEMLLLSSSEPQRIQNLMSYGEWFNDYAGVDEATLESLADQLDTKAMIVLGTQAEFRAIGRDPALAVEKLNGSAVRENVQNNAFDAWLRDRERIDAHRKDVEAARDWYYQAALLGDLGALPFLGDVQLALEETPVSLGWISQEDFDQLPRQAQNPNEVRGAYGVAATRIAPNAGTGYAGLLQGIYEISLTHKPFADALAEQYKRDRADLGLPPLEVPPAEISLDELRDLAARLCPGEEDFL